MKEKEFEPDETETMMAAFKLLDREGNGYIDIDTMRTFLTKEGFLLNFLINLLIIRIEFDQKATENFINFATNGDPKYILLTK